MAKPWYETDDWKQAMTHMEANRPKIDPSYALLQAKAEELKARFPGISFGYIGNVGVDRSGSYDDRSWYVFLPHPGRVGGYIDRVGGFATADLSKMLDGWHRIEAAVERGMVGR